MDSTLVLIVATTITMTGLLGLLAVKQVHSLTASRGVVSAQYDEKIIPKQQTQHIGRSFNQDRIHKKVKDVVETNTDITGNATISSRLLGRNKYDDDIRNVLVDIARPRVTFRDQVTFIQNTRVNEINSLTNNDHNQIHALDLTPSQTGSVLRKLIQPRSHHRVMDRVLKYLYQLGDLKKLEKIECRPFIVGLFETRFGSSDVKRPDKRNDQNMNEDIVTLITSKKSVIGSKPTTHTFVIFVDKASKQVMAFDTEYKQEDARIVSLVDKSWPLLQPFYRMKYTLRNLTGSAYTRKGASTTAWTAWLATAILLNYKGCMSQGDAFDLTPLRSCANKEVVEFWKLVTNI